MFPKLAGRLTETTQYAYLQYLTSVNPVDWVDRGLAYGGSCLSKDGKNFLKRFYETDKDFLKNG